MNILLEIGGIVLVLIGLVFTAQSESYVGPQSSFMYSNPSWTINGLIIIVAGVVVLVVDIIARIVYHLKAKNK
ncbi:MAG TPA: hypothetical protein VJS91_02875 [Nitrososphaeraceae archaeon]|nr:hypothetical protein [Nitrososphaeraceae archaeon]